VVDSINGISRRICLYKPKKLIPVYKELAEMVYNAALEIEISIQGLKDAAANKEKILLSCDKVNILNI